MSELVLVPGFASGRLGCPSDASRVARQIELPVRTVRTLAWDAGRPLSAVLIGAGLGLVGGGLLGLAGRALWTTATLSGFGGLGESYRGARRSVREAATRLAGELRQAADDQRTVHVVAHSLGTEVALRALEDLAASRTPFDGGLILVGGTASRRRDWRRALDLPRGPVVNVYNPRDTWLFLDRIVRIEPAIGTGTLRHPRVRNVRTDEGHAAQLDRLGPILRTTAVALAPA